MRIDGFLNDQWALDEEHLKKMVAQFHEEHERIFAVKEEDAYVECIFWRIEAVGKRKLVQVQQTTTEKVKKDKPLKDTRKAYFRRAGGMVDTTIYQGDSLSPRRDDHRSLNH